MCSLGCITIGVSAEAQTVQPGQWEYVNRVISMEIPGMPPEMTRSMAGRTTTTRSCVTKEDIEKDPRQMFEQNNKDQSCTAERFSMTNGRIDMASTCTDRKNGSTGHMAINGTYTPTTYTARSTITSTQGSQSMKIISEVKGRHTGACK